MPLPEQVVADYQTIRLSLKGHPMEFLRPRFAAEGVLACRDVNHANDRRRVRCAGVVLVRQRPGSAKGVVFMTLEDETGIANIVVWPKVMERFRKEVMGARLVLVEGHIQSSPEKVVHLVAERLIDRSSDLLLLSDDRLGRKPAVPNGPALVEPLQRGRPCKESLHANPCRTTAGSIPTIPRRRSAIPATCASCRARGIFIEGASTIPSRADYCPRRLSVGSGLLRHVQDRAMAAGGCGRPTLPAVAQVHATRRQGIAAGAASGPADTPNFPRSPIS